MNKIAAEEVQITHSVNDSGTKDLDPEMKLWALDGGAGFTEKMGGLNRRVFAVILISASLVLVARLIAPFEMEKDQALQSEVALRLVDGLGLTTTSVKQDSFDLAEVPKPKYVTWFPPSFSLIVAAFLSLGFSLLLSLKVIYGITTLVGWTAWAIVASHLLSRPIRLGPKDYPLHVTIATLLPIFTTPVWQGTDIFLWAGIPFFVILLPMRGARSGYGSIIIVGLLFGMLVSMRYASIFLGLTILLIIAQMTLPDIKAFVKKSALFFVPSMLVLFPVMAYIKLFSSHKSLGPEYISPASHFYKLSNMIFGMLNGSFITSNLVFGFSSIERLCRKLDWGLLNHMIGIPCLLIIILLPLILLKGSGLQKQKPQTDIALSLSFIPLSLVIFLMIANILSGQGLFGVSRYYMPASLCSILIFYALASKRAKTGIIKLASSAIVLLFAIHLCVFMPAQIFSSDKSNRLVEQVLSYIPSKSGTVSKPSTSQDISYPAYRLYSRKESSRLELKRLHELHPDSLILILQNYTYYIYDRFEGGGPTPGLQVRSFHAADIEYWKRAFTSKPIKVFWVLDHPSVSMTKEHLSFIPDYNLRTVFFDSYEKTLILESDFPAGYKFFQ